MASKVSWSNETCRISSGCFFISVLRKFLIKLIDGVIDIKWQKDKNISTNWSGCGSSAGTSISFGMWIFDILDGGKKEVKEERTGIKKFCAFGWSNVTFSLLNVKENIVGDNIWNEFKSTHGYACFIFKRRIKAEWQRYIAALVATKKRWLSRPFWLTLLTQPYAIIGSIWGFTSCVKVSGVN